MSPLVIDAVALPTPARKLSWHFIVGSLLLAVTLAFMLLYPQFSSPDRQTALSPYLQGPLYVMSEKGYALDERQMAALPATLPMMAGSQPLAPRNWLTLGLGREPVWLRFSVRGPLADAGATGIDPVYVEIGLPLIRHIDFYLLDDSGALIRHARGGSAVPVNERDMDLPLPTFKMHLQPGRDHTVVLRLQTVGMMAAPLTIMTADDFIASTGKSRLFTSVYYGTMVAMFLFNFFAFLFVRHVSYLFYAGHMLFSCLFQATLDGYMPEELHFNAHVSARGTALYAGLVGLAAAGFARSLLDIGKQNPLENALLKCCVFFASLGLLLELALHNNLSSYVVIFSVILSSVLIPVVGLKRYFNGSPIAAFFLLAWTLYPCLLILYCLVMTGVFTPNAVTFNATRIGCMLECTLFSMVLGFRMEVLRREKDTLQRTINRQLQAEINEISRGVEALAAGDYAYQLKCKSEAHLAAIVRDFDHLAIALQRSERERNQWISDISHELRTPITVFRATLESFMDGMVPVNEKSLGHLQKEAARLDKLVQDLHDLNQIDQQAWVQTRECVNVQALITHEIGFFEPLLNEHGIACCIHTATPLAMIAGDEKRLSQLFINLLNNTLKYTATAGQLDITLGQDDTRLWICWEDSSPGVAAEHLPLLFDRLYRVDKSRSRQSGGSGLGLAICKAIVEAHGGIISARPSALGGLAIDILLPRCDMP